jgi:hypothetical protein
MATGSICEIVGSSVSIGAFSGFQSCSRVLLAMRSMTPEMVPGVTALLTRPSLVAQPSSVESRCRWGIPPSMQSTANDLQSGVCSPWFRKVPPSLSPKAF